VKLVPAKKSEAQACYCEECDAWFLSPYWSVTKSAALHERGTGHKVKFYACGD
jgi:hypothetical protein